MFHEGDLQSGIGLAVQQSKAVLCFVQDGSDASNEWENILREDALSSSITSQAVALRLEAGSQEAAFLTPICPISSTPAVLVIKNAQLQANFQAAEVSVEELKSRLASTFGLQETPSALVSEAHDASDPAAPGPSGPTTEYLDLQPAPGQMRLPNNAYDALRNHTQKLLNDGKPPSEVFETQLSLLNNIPIFKEEVTRLRAASNRELSEYARSRLLRLPAVGLKIPGQAKLSSQSRASSSTSSPAPPSIPSTSTQSPISTPAERNAPTLESPVSAPVPSQPGPDKQKAQRSDYIKLQREREQKQRDERERIKAQIKADREERRRLDEMRKGIDTSTESTNASSSISTGSQARNIEVRVQVRTFDGSTLRSTFQRTANLSKDIRPWIDSESGNNAPYNLKLILTPLPNRNIEAAEEEQSLSDLGIVGSCTLVMVPVKGYVESYTGSTSSGLLASAVTGGFNLVTGTAGAVFGGVKSILGYSQPQAQTQSGTSGANIREQEGPKVRVRTLADQRAESAKRDQQFYNGNQLNFEPKKDADDDVASSREKD